jgi:hypothetical protein
MKFSHPCTFLCYGKSSAGKSFLVLQLIAQREKYFDVQFDEILYYYSVWNDSFENVKDVIFLQLPIQDIPRDKKERLLIIDDVIGEKSTYERLVSLYCKESAHNRISCITLLHDYFINKQLRTVSLNTRVYFLFGNQRDIRSVSAFFSQFQENREFLLDAYKKATEKKYGYLCINFDRPDLLKYSTDILAENVCFFVKRGIYRNPIPVDE